MSEDETFPLPITRPSEFAGVGVVAIFLILIIAGLSFIMWLGGQCPHAFNGYPEEEVVFIEPSHGCGKDDPSPAPDSCLSDRQREYVRRYNARNIPIVDMEPPPVLSPEADRTEAAQYELSLSHWRMKQFPSSSQP